MFATIVVFLHVGKLRRRTSSSTFRPVRTRTAEVPRQAQNFASPVQLADAEFQNQDCWVSHRARKRGCQRRATSVPLPGSAGFAYPAKADEHHEPHILPLQVHGVGAIAQRCRLKAICCIWLPARRRGISLATSTGWACATILAGSTART